MGNIFEDDVEFMTIEELEKEIGWPPPYTATLGLHPYIRRFNRDVMGIEIGTGRGESAYLLLEKCPNIELIYTIDPFKEYMDWNGIIPGDKQAKCEGIAQKNLSKFGNRAKIISSTSQEAVNLFKEDFYDFLFIDGDHSVSAVMGDLSNYYSKIKSGGIVAIHDSNLDSVRSGVKAFKEQNRIRIPSTNTSNGVLFWYKA